MLNYNCSYEITSGGTGSGNIAKEGTTISVTRITTPGSEVTLTIDFTYGSETVTFSTRYNNLSLLFTFHLILLKLEKRMSK
jgi:hypothetical protein